MGKPIKTLVCGAGGFIGWHLVNFLKDQGHCVYGADRCYPRFGRSRADRYIICDLRYANETLDLFRLAQFQEVYQLAADMGGMGYIHTNAASIMTNNAEINSNLARVAIARHQVPRFLFTSSVCVYPNQELDAPKMTEGQVYPASPHNEYGWEKLYSERMFIRHGQEYATEVRIVRLQNTYGSHCDWWTTRAKAPAALCRKVIVTEDGEAISVWGDGKAMRSYTYIDDIVTGIWQVMQSTQHRPVNLGTGQTISVNDLARQIIAFSGKALAIANVTGHAGVRNRNFSKDRANSMGWWCVWDMKKGLEQLYRWIQARIEQGDHYES